MPDAMRARGEAVDADVGREPAAAADLADEGREPVSELAQVSGEAIVHARPGYGGMVAPGVAPTPSRSARGIAGAVAAGVAPYRGVLSKERGVLGAVLAAVKRTLRGVPAVLGLLRTDSGRRLSSTLSSASGCATAYLTGASASPLR